MHRFLIFSAMATAGCVRTSVGLALEEGPLEPTTVADERSPASPLRPFHAHGPDLAYLRSGCSAWTNAPESEPDDPPVDPSDPFASLYVKAPPLASVSTLRTAPRGTLAYLRDGAIWISAADGTSRRRLVQAPWKENKKDPVAHGAPHFVLGGDELLFVTTQGDPRGRIVRLDRDCQYASSIGTRICADSISCFDPTRAKLVVSPDGTRVLVEGQTGPSNPLRMIDLRTGREEIVVRHHDAPAAWSPDGDRIAYRPDFEKGIAVVDLLSNTRDVVTHPSIRQHEQPVFGQDGLTLWFTVESDEGTVDTLLMRTAVPRDLRTHTPPPAYAEEALLASHVFFEHPSAALTRGPRAERMAVTLGHRMGGMGDPWVSMVTVRSTEPGSTTSFTFGKGRSSPHHNEWGPVFSPDGDFVAATMETCVNEGCARGVKKIAITDGVVEAFVATGHSVDWTDLDR